MPEVQDARNRSVLLSRILAGREDGRLRRIIEDHSETLTFSPLEEFMIGDEAWRRIRTSAITPSLAFAHPDLLAARPEVSQYYRGISLLSRKQVASLAVRVDQWEDGSLKKHPKRETCLRVARLYNAIISSLIEESVNWSLENGYRNILATMGITLDGMYRNRIGQIAESLIKDRLEEWLVARSLLEEKVDEGRFRLVGGATMRYGSEPDIEFQRGGRVAATIEIKGGKDPAGALERLGAVRKSFAETPPGCVNFLVAGVVTEEMRTRLDQMGVVKAYLLDDLVGDSARWDEFVREVFHHALRIV